MKLLFGALFPIVHNSDEYVKFIAISMNVVAMLTFLIQKLNTTADEYTKLVVVRQTSYEKKNSKKN